MADLPYMPYYVDDFEAATAHLTIEEDGAYNRLLRLCWRTSGCSLPDDPEWIARRMRVDLETYHRVIEPIIDEFFRRQKGRVFQKRQTAEWVRAIETSDKRAAAGKKGGRPRNPLKTKEVDKSREKAGRKPGLSNQNHIHKEKKEKKTLQKKGSRLSENWTLPRAWGQWALDQQIAENEVRDQAARFRDYWIGVPGQKGIKLDWLATWRNWMRNSGSRRSGYVNGAHPEPEYASDHIAAEIRAKREAKAAGGTR